MKILTVDDDPSILEVLDAALSSLDNYEVVAASSAAEGLEILMDEPGEFAAALIDIQMPEMNGIEMCREIRKLPQYQRLPLIVVTAMSQRTYIADAFRAGATDYVTKPFDLIDLRSRVASAVRQNKRDETRAVAREHQLGDTMTLRNVTRFLGQDEYENFVMQVSQSLTSKSSVVAIKILGVGDLHDTLSSEQFEEAVQCVGAAISVMTRQEGHMISYRGNGVFLCIRIGRYDVLPETFETILNKQIFANKPASLSKHNIKVCLGETTVLKSTSKTGALDALTKAVESADARAEKLSAPPDVSIRVLQNQSRSVEEERVERRVYSLLLKDVLRDEFAQSGPKRKPV